MRMSLAEHIVAAIDAAFIAIIVSCIMSMSIAMGISVADMLFIIAIVSIGGPPVPRSVAPTVRAPRRPQATTT
ncbi:hypothetical protein GCM10017714_21670 [Curtobacterium pusillum]